MKRKTWFLYILKCSDASFYTGITTDISKRVAEHNTKKGAKAIQGRLPVELAYSELHPNKSSALKREYQIKKLNHLEKQTLISQSSASSKK